MKSLFIALAVVAVVLGPAQRVSAEVKILATKIEPSCSPELP
jgi:hypothetical protein